MIKYFENTMKILQNSISSLSDETWNEVVDYCYKALKNGNKLIASGLGKNVPICEKFVGTLNSFGINATFLHTNTAVHGDLGVVHKGDIVFLLSKSGNTDESIVLYDHLVNKGAIVFLLSCNEKSALTAITEHKIILNLEHEGDLWNVAPNNSTTIFLIFLQGLAIKMCELMGVSREDFGQNHPGGAIGKSINKLDVDDNTLTLSSLPKTWVFDLDGTIVEHNGYKKYGHDVLLDGIKEQISAIPKEDLIIIFSARESKYEKQTIEFLNQNQIKFDKIIFDMPVGERILINDQKPSGLKCAYAINTIRDEYKPFKVKIKED